ncbi:MAG: apolipoprotein N-acyltransferase [Hamadaea sp.]|nr:apolipoprotein N-acyltransferase [Hamadaea sp.]
MTAAVAPPDTPPTAAGGPALAGPQSARPVPYWLGFVLSALSGAALLLSFPSPNVWWLAPFGVAGLALAVHRRRPRTGALFGFVTGVVFFAPLLSWTNTHVGPAPWLLLVALQAGYIALLGLVLALVSPLVDRHRWSWPLIIGVLWVAQEALRGRTPFGGFPWGRLAFSQADAPTLRLAAAGGAPLVTFAVAVAGGLLLLAGWQVARAKVTAGMLALGAVALMAVGLAVPLSAPDGPGVTVAIVQGNVPRIGLDFNAQRRAVLDNHVSATEALAADVAAGKVARPDLVIWPENSSDIDPLRNPDAAAAIERAAEAVGVPILVGAVMAGDEPGQARNVGMVWEADRSVTGSYTKQHPVPFAEYLPWRGLIEPIAKLVTEKASLLRSDFQPGQGAGVLTMGPATIGDVICFEIAYDGLVHDTVTDGAQLLVVQTNNATFNVDEARQQMAMVRLRAVEHGRESLMASTVGISGFVDAEGGVHDASEFFTRDVMVRVLRQETDLTLATRLSFWPEAVLTAAAVGIILAAAFLRVRARRGRYSVRRSAVQSEATVQEDS